MKTLLYASFILISGFTSCQQNETATKGEPGEGWQRESPEVALCEFSSTDSVTAMERLQGKWELRGLQTNYLGTQPDEFLTGEQLEEKKTLVFYENGEFEQQSEGRRIGQREKFSVVGQSLPPVGYQFWFCGENTLAVSNVIADGGIEVFIKVEE